jgi:tetratricopeptide (TPR) repeat protein
VQNNSKISVRAQTSAYLSAAAGGSFLSAYLLYAGYDTIALGSALFSIVCYPFLAFSDRIVFDGKRLGRTGFAWRLWMIATGQRRKVKPRSVVHVETEALRAFRRGSNVTYLYRTSLYSDDVSFRFGSGRGYREMIKVVLPLIPEGCLDVRSAELRDHLTDASAALKRARSLNIPSADVLNTGAILSKEERRSSAATLPGEDEIRRSDELRSVANELRANGRLLQALEAFRRALRLTPNNGRLLFEFGRCLQSLAAAKRDERLDRKSLAMLRLAELRSGGDTHLLSRLGETYFSIGAWRRAENVFKKAVDQGAKGYRTFRGLGELALRDGKIAHAINYFAESAQVAKPSQVSRWAHAETEYLRRLNEDDEYMELELGRINLFDTFDGARRTSVKVFGFGLALIIIGISSGVVLITDVGWAVSGIALAISLASYALKQTFASRIPFDLIDKE